MRLEVLKIIAKTINTRKRLPKGQSKMDNPGYTRRAKTKQKQNAICVGHHYTETNTNNVNKT
jgi:quinolinate synthase